jgi:alkylated DNA repair dioxygenase AlkB
MREKLSVEDSLAYLHQHEGRVEYYPEFLSPIEAEHYKQGLLTSVEFNSEEESKVRQPFSRDKIAIPRRQTAYGDVGTFYKFTGCVVPARPWIPLLSTLRELLSERTGFAPNFVLINYYRDGHDCIGWHADDEGDLGDGA